MGDDLYPAALALQALFKGEDTAESEAGALLVADFFFGIRKFMGR